MSSRNWSRLIAIGKYSISRIGKQRHKEFVRRSLLSRHDLPSGDWHLTQDHVARTGAGKSNPREEIVRARRIGASSGKRLWKSTDGTRIVTAFIVMFATEQDARSYAPHYLEEAGRKPFSGHTDLVEERVEVEALRRLIDYSALYDMRYKVHGGSASERVIVQTIGDTASCLDFWSSGDPWTWDDIGGIAKAQAVRIREELGSA